MSKYIAVFLRRGWWCNWHNKSSKSRTDPERSRTKDKYAGKSQRVWFLFLSDTCAQLPPQRPVAGAGTAGDSWPVIARDRPLLSRQSVHSPEEPNKGEAPCSAPAEGRGYSIVCVWLQRAARAHSETMEPRTESIFEALLKIVWYTEHHKSPAHCELGLLRTWSLSVTQLEASRGEFIIEDGL